MDDKPKKFEFSNGIITFRGLGAICGMIVVIVFASLAVPEPAWLDFQQSIDENFKVIVVVLLFYICLKD